METKTKAYKKIEKGNGKYENSTLHTSDAE